MSSKDTAGNKKAVDFDTLVELLAANAFIAYWNTVGEHQSVAQAHYFKRMGDPKPGDLVLEMSSLNQQPAINRLGRLISVEKEPYPDWDESEGEAPSRDVWTIKTLDGRMFRWENCRFCVVPEKATGHQGYIASF